METKYFVSPTPPKELTPEIIEAYAKENLSLEALYENGDPFGSKEDAGVPDMPY